MGNITNPRNNEIKLVVDNIVTSRKQYLVTEITNLKLLEIRDTILKSNQILRQTFNQINQDLKFSIASTGSYRGQKGSDDFVRSGYGETIGDDQNFYKLGEWKYDAVEGYGCSIYVKDDYYEYYVGNFQKGRAHGEGEIRKSDRSYYKGNFTEGQPNGQGTIVIFQDNCYSCYDGEVLNGKMNGKGQLVFYKGQTEDIKMKGEFENNQMIQGELVYPQIGTYNGQMKDGKFHGKGVMKWVDGSFYDGEFSEHKRHGLGVFRERSNPEAEWWYWENDEKKQKVHK